MTYKINGKSIILNLMILLIPLLIAIIAIIFYLDNLRAVIIIATITLAWLMPQIYLAIQYIKFTNYHSFKIDYDQELFIIKKSDTLLEKKFTELKTIQYHRVFIVPRFSPALVLAQYFYYYRLEFNDGTTYYLTNLLTPHPILKGNGVFYPYFIEVDRKYASIKG